MAALLLPTLLLLAATTWPSAPVLEGFGAETPGGARGQVYRVTSLSDSGPGTLRDAVSRGGRYVVFEVGGTIRAMSHIYVRGAFITIDGTTAPAPGVTITNRGLYIRGDYGAHDVVVRGIRVRDAAASDATDCIQVAAGAYNIAIDHVSTSGCGDGNIDITNGARNITVSWSLLAEPRSGKSMLIRFGATRITLHHNLLVRGTTRNPLVDREGNPPDTGTTIDMRNNVIGEWGPGYGSLIRAGATANAVANLYSNPTGGLTDQRQALMVCKGDGTETPWSLSLCANGTPSVRARAFVSGNVSLDGVDLEAVGSEPVPFPAPAVTTQDACTAAAQVVSGVGAPFRDTAERRYVALVRLSACDALTLGAPTSARSTAGATGGSPAGSEPVRVTPAGGVDR